MLLFLNSTGKVVYGLQVTRNCCWLLGAAYLPEAGPQWISGREMRNGMPAPVRRAHGAAQPRSGSKEKTSGTPIYELRHDRAADRWVLTRGGSGAQLAAARCRQQLIGRSTALLRGTGGGLIWLLNEAGKIESTVDVRPAGPPLGGFMVSETPVEEPT